MKYIFAIYFLLVVFFSCKTEPERVPHLNNSGGALRINQKTAFTSIFPHGINDNVSYLIASQIYEGLVKINPYDLKVIPAVARTWKIDSTGTHYRFFLRNDVFFHDDNCFNNERGRQVTAYDFVFSFRLLSTPDENNLCFHGLFDNVAGADEFYKKTSGNGNNEPIEGLYAENDTVLSIKLKKPNPLFLYLLASPAASVIPEEAFNSYRYKSAVGSGPFILSRYPLEGEPMVLVRNRFYFRSDNKGNYLPYLDSVIISFNSSTFKELSMLENSELDMALNVDDVSITRFLENNLSMFKGSEPELILFKANNENGGLFQHIIRRNVRDLYINYQNNIDFSVVYFTNKEKNCLPGTDTQPGQ